MPPGLQMEGLGELQIPDDYSEEDNRIVHFVLLPDHVTHIKNQMKKMGE